MRRVNHMNGYVAATLLMAGGVGLSGCVVGPNYKAPATTMPTGWVGPASRPATLPSEAHASAADVAEYWKSFKRSDIGSPGGAGGER